MEPRLRVRSGTSVETDVERAVADLKAQIDQPELGFVLLFCSPTYDLERLADALRQAFSCPLYGCTSSGQIGPGGFHRGGITATSFSSDDLGVEQFAITPLSTCIPQAVDVGLKVHERLVARASGRRAFALCFIDGLSLSEERLTSALYQSIGDVPIVGGSAGDDLSFERTHVLVNGRFVTDAASILLVETSLPFAHFKFQHFVASDRKLVVTAADPERRIVREINGEPAADAYAELLGLERHQLTSEVFTKHPLVLTIQGDHFVRSIQRIDPDGSIAFLCAMEEGLLLSIGQGVDPEETVRHAFARVDALVPEPVVVIGCDCVLRRLEFETREMSTTIGALYAERNVVGFSTYGEQFNALHVNQTFTGVAIGG